MQVAQWTRWCSVLWFNIADLSDHCSVISLQMQEAGLCYWPSVTGMEHCAPHTRAVLTATCLERKVAGRENWFHLPGPRCPLTCMSKAVLTAPLERSTCPYQRSLLSFSMRSRSSMPSRASSSVDPMVQCLVV